MFRHRGCEEVVRESSSSQIHQFGEITVDAAGMRVLKGSEPVALEPKSMKVLLYLIENRGRLVTKEELLKSVWQDTFVTDNALTRTVAQIRKALGDDAKQGRIIETVPRLGYRFIAGEAANPASPEKTGDETVMTPPRDRRVMHWLYGAAAPLILVGLALAWNWMTAKPTPAPAVKLARPTQFTTSAGLDLYPAFSPDGESLAYSSDESGSFEIYVKPLTRGARVVQVTSDGRQNVQTAWSPDGRYIAYHSARENGIWVVPATGGSARKLTDFGNGPAWSPDGRRLVFHTKSFTSVAGSDQACGGAVGAIWVVAAQGGEAFQVPLPPDSAVCQNTDPSWTPDGRIIFARKQPGFTEITSIAPDGSEVRVVERVNGFANSPHWSKEGSIFFSTFASDGDFTIQRLPVDASGRKAGPAEEIVGRSVGVPRAPAVSPDGRRLAYTVTLPVSQIDSLPVRRARGAPGIEAAGPAAAMTKENIYRYALPCISPDGRHVAYTLVQKGSNFDIWVSDIDGGNARLLSMTPSDSFSAGWLPDSSGVAYVKYFAQGTELWSTSLRDGTERRVSPVTIPGKFPLLSPDGRYFVYHTPPSSQGMKLRKLDLKTGQSSDVVNVAGVNSGFGVWSRDSKQIAFLTQHGENDHLATVSADGGPYTEWTAGPGKTWPGGWTADGNAIVAACQREGVWNVCAVGRDHSERKLTDYTSLREYVRYARLSPASDRVVYEYNETKGNIFIGDLVR